MKNATITQVDNMAKLYVTPCPADVDKMIRDNDEYLLMRRRQYIQMLVSSGKTYRKLTPDADLRPQIMAIQKEVPGGPLTEQEIASVIEEITGQRPIDPRDEAIAVLREFIEDIKAAFGDDIDKTALHIEWPDLEVTYHNAVKVLEKLS